MNNASLVMALKTGRKTQIAARVPDRMLRVIDRIAEDTDSDRTNVMLNAMAIYLASKYPDLCEELNPEIVQQQVIEDLELLSSVA